ncbi:hypothetical protein CKN61_13070 [Carnobacterium divergens]|nr:hypothetical protein [Carnobacterium divergens]TFI86752.1 hypothetical protein CKN61_13070 [Carnobacterium divergens]
MGKKKMYNKNGESTSSVSKVSYDIEKMLAQGISKSDISDYIKELYKDEDFPENLQYMDCYYDEKSGTSGSAFLDTNTNTVVLGYAGTNMDADGIKDILTDAGLVIGNHGHSAPAVNFYNNIAGKGYPITLTGHSLGGDISVLVALITNNPSTVTYNGAPLSMSNILSFLMDFFQLNPYAQSLIKLFVNENSDYLKKLMTGFNGNITRFVSERDELNAVANAGKGVYIGNEYIIYNKNPHSIDFFLDEDMQTYLTAILDLEQQKIINADIGVDVDGDGKIDVLRSARQLVVKNLLGKPGSNGGGNGEKIKINPEGLLNLSVNMQSMSSEDIGWIDQNITQCENKNESIKNSFDTRKNSLNQSVMEGLTNSGLGILLTGIDDSFGKIKDKKGTLESLDDFNSYSVTRKFDAWGSSGKRTWFKDGEEWTFSDVSDFGKQLKSLTSASSILVHNIETKGEFEYNSGSGGTKIYHYDTISDISKAFVDVTNALEPKISKAFKGLGLRSGKNDGISQSLTEVFEVEHQNTSELAKAITNISSLSSSIAINYQEKDKWIAQAIEKGDMTASTSTINVPKTYEAFLKETEIFDDVTDVLQAFDKQVEDRSKKLGKIIASSYSDILDKFEAKTKVVRDGMNEFKKLINSISEELDKSITYEEETLQVATLPVDTSKTTSPGPVAPPIKWEKVKTTGDAGTLGSHLPADVQAAIEDAKNNILPLFLNNS